MKLNLGKNHDTISVAYDQKSDTVFTGLVDRVFPQENMMSISIPRSDAPGTEKVKVSINSPMTDYGQGLRIVPMSGRTTACYLEDPGGKMYHIGYDHKNMGDIIDSQDGDSQLASDKLLLRYLDEGEVQLLSAYGNEIYMSADGSVYMKAQLGSYLKLDNYMSRLEGSFANLKYDMDRVRLYAGNIIRPSKKDTKEDQYIVLGKKDDTIKGADELEEDEEWEPLKEFTVQVGTIPSDDYVTDDDKNGPTVGLFTISDSYVRQDGTALYAAGKPVQAMLKTGSGGGFIVSDDGSFYIMDYNNWSATKFPTHSERSLRVQQTYISVQDVEDSERKYKTDIQLSHESNARIDITELEQYGVIRMQEETGRYFLLDGYGANFVLPEATFNVNAKDINLLIDGGAVSIGALPTDGVIKATHSSTLFDTHYHAGPCGPPLPTFQWTPLVQITNSPLVAQGLKVT